MKIIAHMHTDFKEKFGVPRQSGLAQTRGRIVFEPEFRNETAVRGLEDFSHLWVIWMFSLAVRETWSPTVRPPRLGGNQRMGVFATRSPFRPNPIGLSCVKIERVEIHSQLGPVIHVIGADMVDNTPIFDIKPYLSYADSIPNAVGGFTDSVERKKLQVDFPIALQQGLEPALIRSLITVLENDPRPSYQHDEQRIYGFDFGDHAVKFSVCGQTLLVRECCLRKNEKK